MRNRISDEAWTAAASGRDSVAPRDLAARPRPVPPWERLEPFPGANALEDLSGAAGDPAAALRAVARYVAVRVVLRAATGASAGGSLDLERAVAAEYVEAAAAAGDAERRALESAVRLAARDPDRRLCGVLRAAGGQAAVRSAPGGAFSFHHTAYHLARIHGWPGEGSRAAVALSRLVRRRGGGRAAKRWRRRAVLLATLAARGAVDGDGGGGTTDDTDGPT